MRSILATTTRWILADLKQRRQAAFEKLDKLGAEKKSLHAESMAPWGQAAFLGHST